MTNERAIEVIKEHNRILLVEKEEECSEVTTALLLAVWALAKQIPQKPIDKSIEYNGTYGFCPYCNSVVFDFADYKGCRNCLQALDWS